MPGCPRCGSGPSNTKSDLLPERDSEGGQVPIRFALQQVLDPIAMQMNSGALRMQPYPRHAECEAMFVRQRLSSHHAAVSVDQVERDAGVRLWMGTQLPNQLYVECCCHLYGLLRSRVMRPQLF